ncbi:hypothetical protein [Microvirga arabica]|uniref:hypothetical protein n=1 Tax=Microvirga arabica TaxID=1128671 RepID=UPI00193A2DB1|nr:hypothetical protein [Microvirga arabica]MBM1169622.1 hypothetical protein [Microvirga arabica]
MSALPASNALRPKSFSGWALSPAIELDNATPSFLTFIFLASSLKRQAIFSALAALTREGPESLAARLRSLAPTDCHSDQNPHEEIARALLTTSRAREIVRAVYGEAPDGLLGMLSRIGAEPLCEPDLYFRLFETFADPQHRMRRDVLRRRSGSITATQIEIVHHLEPVLVHGNILRHIYSISQAESANAALALVRGTVSFATDDVIRQSIENLGEKTDLAEFFNRWLQKMDNPPACPPIPKDDPDVAVMTSGEAMASLGRRFRNCSTTRIVYIAQGAEALLEWKRPPGLVAQCHRLTNGGWVLTQIYARDNGRVDPAEAGVFRRKLESLGVLALSPGEFYPNASGVLTLLGAWGGVGRNLGFDGIEEEFDELERDIAEIGDAA